ncbi:hypothetical protein HCH_00364 [Hahella chejuensis KCTC 2396]|uniref:Uncharacterized protein n=1 Tax=Hahella chejuensis (strain KCTC 2396) TaxID=349521 RepID=Q2SPZ8_HAHCH|nr:hypothetical protein HCH_00364 [Hahella chejuensis KCTC 2396]
MYFGKLSEQVDDFLYARNGFCIPESGQFKRCKNVGRRSPNGAYFSGLSRQQ